MTKFYNKTYLKQNRRDLRKRMTQSETLLWSCLRSKQSGFKFRRQYSIGNYIVDFCCPRLKLVIELDGLTHNYESVHNKDIIKDQFLKDRGFMVLRFSDSDILNNLSEDLDIIWMKCNSLVNKNKPPLTPP